MQHLRLACAVLALAIVASLVPDARAQFPQLKINYIDVSQAPKIRIWASVASKGWRPPGDKDILGVSVLKKPDKGQAFELFKFEEGELVWPKSLSDAEKKKKEETMAPEVMLAAEVEQGSAIVVVVPGFQDPEYRNGTLGERSRNGAALFFKKLGKANEMNTIWYNDYVWSYVFTDGRTSGLTRLEPELDKCAKWEREQMTNWGLSEAELIEKLGPPPEGPRKNEARCGLHKDYGEFGKYIQKSAYDGFWPQLFGLTQRMCVKPEHEIKRTGLAADAGEVGEKRLTAMDAALEMLVKGGRPGMPKILILTGDGRDGYINAAPDCRQKYLVDCQGKDNIKAARGKAQRDLLNACVQEQVEKDIRIEQAAFVEKLPTWLGLAKAANIRIYSVVHPTAPPYARERMEVLAWRTGGTSRYARDANEVVDHYDSLISELNNQIVVTFVDEDAKPQTEQGYIIKASGHIGESRGAGEALARADATSEPFLVAIPPAIERSTINEFKSFGESKLGKTGFMAALIGVGLLLLIILFKLGKKLFGDGSAKAGKAAKGAAKGGKGKKNDKADKAKAKAIEKAKKAKEAQKKAAAKAKGK
jgi:hypothetical protein